MCKGEEWWKLTTAGVLTCQEDRPAYWPTQHQWRRQQLCPMATGWQAWTEQPWLELRPVAIGEIHRRFGRRRVRRDRSLKGRRGALLYVTGHGTGPRQGARNRQRSVSASASAIRPGRDPRQRRRGLGQGVRLSGQEEQVGCPVHFGDVQHRQSKYLAAVTMELDGKWRGTRMG